MTLFDFRLSQRRPFDSLSEQEILALAISSEEEDGRIYATYANRLRDSYPGTAEVFDAMVAEENEHRLRLIEMHEARFGSRIPLIRREYVSGFYTRRPYWLVETLGLERVREEAAAMEKKPPHFISAQRNGHKTLGFANCSATSPMRRPAMSMPFIGPSRRICRTRCVRPRMRKPGATSCSRTCSPASPA